VLIEKKFIDKVKVIPVSTLPQVIDHALEGKGKKELLKKLKAMKPLDITAKVELESEKKVDTSNNSIDTDKRDIVK
jgi:predicted ATP-dependent protease